MRLSGKISCSAMATSTASRAGHRGSLWDWMPQATSSRRHVGTSVIEPRYPGRSTEWGMSGPGISPFAEIPGLVRQRGLLQYLGLGSPGLGSLQLLETSAPQSPCSVQMKELVVSKLTIGEVPTLVVAVGSTRPGTYELR